MKSFRQLKFSPQVIRRLKIWLNIFRVSSIRKPNPTRINTSGRERPRLTDTAIAGHRVNGSGKVIPITSIANTSIRSILMMTLLCSIR